MRFELHSNDLRVASTVAVWFPGAKASQLLGVIVEGRGRQAAILAFPKLVNTADGS